MSAENVALITRGYEHYATTGEPIWDDFAEDIVVHDHQSPDQGEYTGHDGYQRWLDDWDAAWDEWNIEVEDILDAGDAVLVLIHHTARGHASGLDLDSHDGMLWHFDEGGKVHALDYYTGRERALEAAGLAA